jgi:hypothetical protein
MMYECPNKCDSQRFFQAIVQSKHVTVNEHGETIRVDEVGEPSTSTPRCKACGAEVTSDE